MANAHHSDDASHGSYGSYLIGFVLSVVLTAIPFGVVMHPTFSKSTTLMIVLVTAIVQVLVHLKYFLHLDSSPEQRDSVLSWWFAVLVIVLLVGLSVWIMFSIHTAMMAK